MLMMTLKFCHSVPMYTVEINNLSRIIVTYVEAD